MKKSKFRNGYVEIENILLTIRDQIKNNKVNREDFKKLLLQKTKIQLYLEQNLLIPNKYFSIWSKLIFAVTNHFNLEYYILEGQARNDNNSQEFKDWWNRLEEEKNELGKTKVSLP